MLKRPFKNPSRKKWVLIAALMFFIGILFTVGFNLALETTNTTEFCTSCHTMRWPFEDLQETTHWSGITGVHAKCADCHVPKAFWPKSFRNMAISTLSMNPSYPRPMRSFLQVFKRPPHRMARSTKFCCVGGF